MYRGISRANSNESNIYEFCRRVLEEKNEFDDVKRRIAELDNPKEHPNVCYIDNSNEGETYIEYNLEKIVSFIYKNVK